MKRSTLWVALIAVSVFAVDFAWARSIEGGAPRLCLGLVSEPNLERSFQVSSSADRPTDGVICDCTLSGGCSWLGYCPTCPSEQTCQRSFCLSSISTSWIDGTCQ